MSSGITLPHGLPTYLIVDPLFALLIYNLAFGCGPLAWFLSRRMMIVLGQASYAIYLLHSPLLSWADRLTQPFDEHGQGVTMHSTGGFFAWIGVVISLSMAVLYGIEEPARKAIIRSIRRHEHMAIRAPFPGIIIPAQEDVAVRDGAA
jgi:peptidoglycan/LPS O-acetylase OafA/YrhL